MVVKQRRRNGANRCIDRRARRAARGSRETGGMTRIDDWLIVRREPRGRGVAEARIGTGPAHNWLEWTSSAP